MDTLTTFFSHNLWANLQLLEICAQLSDEELDSTLDGAVEIDWDGTLRNVPKTILLAQATNHATEHRTQIMTILTQLGIQPPELDRWACFDEVG